MPLREGFLKKETQELSGQMSASLEGVGRSILSKDHLYSFAAPLLATQVRYTSALATGTVSYGKLNN